MPDFGFHPPVWSLKRGKMFPLHWVVFRLSALGDVVLTTGPLRHWHETRGMTFTIVTRDAFTPLFTGHPGVTDVIGLKGDELRFPRILNVFSGIARKKAGAGLLDLHGTLRSRLLAGLWRGPVKRYPKRSMERRLFLRSGGRFFQDALLRFNVAQRYALALESSAPAAGELLPCIRLSEEEKTTARNLLGCSGSRPLVALHPFATHALKAWPLEYWRTLAGLCLEHGMDVAVVGRDADGESHGIQGINLVNGTSLRELCAVLWNADRLITGDSGPMHLASAVGTPVTALFGPTTGHWGFYPAGTRDLVLERALPCRPCSLHGGTRCPREQKCLRDILPEELFSRLVADVRKDEGAPWAEQPGAGKA